MSIEKDLSTAYVNSFTYNFIPNFSGERAWEYDYDIVSQVVSWGTADNIQDLKKFWVYLSKWIATTVLRFDITVLYQATPKA